MMSERAHSIVFAVLWGAAVAFGATVLVSAVNRILPNIQGLSMMSERAVQAHDKHHSELSDWFRSLTNWEGTVMRPALKMQDWQTICETDTGECHYQVRLDGKWWNVPPTAVVQSGNRVGPTLVWPIYYGDHEKTVLIRCLLPGAGTQLVAQTNLG